MHQPTLTRDQARELDRRAIEEFGMSGLVLMENAGRGCVDLMELVGIGGPVVVCCGRGNNAGDGFVIARHLDLRDAIVKVLLCAPPDQLRGDALVNYQILVRSGIPLVECWRPEDAGGMARHLTGADWIVDALLGTGASGPPRPPLDRIIASLNAHPCRRLAVDLPSGLDCDSGIPAEPTIVADHTCTFVAAKTGFNNPQAALFLGQVYVLDIGAPRKLVDEIVGRLSNLSKPD
jgi:NAD(P)H-hydrate epimerase